MSNKTWACISLGLFLLGGIISYTLFPKTYISSWKTQVKEKLIIKDGKITIAYGGDLRLFPDGELLAIGDGIELTFGSYSSASTTTTSEAIKRLNVSKIGAVINPFDLREFGITYSTPFIFGTEIQVFATQKALSEFKVLVGVSLPI